MLLALGLWDHTGLFTTFLWQPGRVWLTPVASESQVQAQSQPFPNTHQLSAASCTHKDRFWRQKVYPTANYSASHSSHRSLFLPYFTFIISSLDFLPIWKSFSLFSYRCKHRKTHWVFKVRGQQVLIAFSKSFVIAGKAQMLLLTHQNNFLLRLEFKWGKSHDLKACTAAIYKLQTQCLQ